MSPDAYQRALAYFQSEQTDPWRWTEGGKVLVWTDGTTVGFREEVADILEALAPEGLPPFQAVMVLLGACRGKFPSAAQVASHSAPVKLRPANSSQRTWIDPANQEFSEFIARLRALYESPKELRSSIWARANLIEAIFDGHPERRIQPARDIVQVLREGALSEDVLNYPPSLAAGERQKRWIAGLMFLHHRLKELSPENLRLRMETGLEETPGEAELELKPAQRVRELLAKLRNDPDYEGLAMVTRDVMAAIYLPRALSEVDELPLGGFSDISNRGSLDRLLPSELANDDLTLAARITLNEALYFRREPPANHPPGRFAVLLDAGIRTWGLPRVFATAVALALLGREERRGEVTTWRAVRNGVERIDLLTRAGVVKHLSALDSSVHPGASLQPFFAQLTGEPEIEAVLVTQRDSLADPEFQAQLREVTSKTFYIAAVDRDGSFEMFLHPHAHSLLCQAVIPLDALFAEPRARAVPLRDKVRHPDLPLILSLQPFPFLLPVIGELPRVIRYSTEGGIAVTQDRRLLRWESPRNGAELLASNLPRGRTLWIGTSNFGSRIHVLKHNSTQALAMLTTWNATTDEFVTHQIQLPDNQSIRAYGQHGVLFLINRRRVIGVDMDTGRTLGTIAPPTPRLASSGKYFRLANAVNVFLSYNGQELQFQPVTLKPFLPPRDILTLFDREGFEGPWILTVRGEIYSHAGERVINLARTIFSFNISEDGHRILVPSVAGSPGFQLIDLEKNRCIVIPSDHAPAALEPRIKRWTANLRVHFSAIHLSEVGEISLLDKRGTWHEINNLILKPWQSPRPDPPNVRRFEPLLLRSLFPFKLKVASWPDGRRAWLDSRGLLHLKSADPSMPEISFVLSDDLMAAWSSDGFMAGAPFSIPPSAARISAEQMMEKVHRLTPAK